MTILMIIPTLAFGGAQNIAVGLAEEAYLKGHKLQFVSFYGDNSYEDRLEAMEVNLINFNYCHGFGFKSILKLRELRFDLFKTIEELKPDVIHTHLFLTKMLVFRFKHRLNIPIVDTQHDVSPWWSFKGFNNKLKSYVEGYFANHIANHIIAISKGVEDGLLKKLKVDPSKITVISNFIEINPYNKNVSDDDLSFNIYIISRLDLHKKGLDLLVFVVDYLVNSLKESSFKVKIVGDGSDKQKLKQLIVDSNLEGYFEFLGYQKDIYKFYTQADIVLLPSRWEGFGLTAAEAAISEIPVIAFDIPGLNEVVVNNETGILVKPYNIKEFAKAVYKLKSNSLLRKEMGSNAKIRASILFSKEQAFMRYESVYLDLIKKTSS